MAVSVGRRRNFEAPPLPVGMRPGSEGQRAEQRQLLEAKSREAGDPDADLAAFATAQPDGVNRSAARIAASSYNGGPPAPFPGQPSCYILGKSLIRLLLILGKSVIFLLFKQKSGHRHRGVFRIAINARKTVMTASCFSAENGYRPHDQGTRHGSGLARKRRDPANRS